VRRLPLVILPLLVAALAPPARAGQAAGAVVRPADAALPATGAHPGVLTVGLLLVAGGIGLHRAMRYQGRHAAPPVWLARLLDLWPSPTSQPAGGRHGLGRQDPAPVRRQRAG
jgi:hypothetical protein